MTWLTAFAFCGLALLLCYALIYFADLARTAHLWIEGQTDMPDLNVVRAHIADARSRVLAAQKNAADFNITDEKSYEFAFAVIKEVKRVAKETKEHKEAYMKPLRELTKLVTDDAQPVLNAADEVERVLKRKADAYRDGVERAKLAAQEEARRALAAQAPPAVVREAHTVVASLNVPKIAGVSKPRDNWQSRCVDISLVPHAFFVRALSQALVDYEIERQVREAKAAGKLPSPVIPGFEIWNQPITSVRS